MEKEKSENVFIGNNTAMTYLSIVYATVTRHKRAIIEARGRYISKAILVAIRAKKFYSMKIKDVVIDTVELERKIEGQEQSAMKEFSKIQIFIE